MTGELTSIPGLHLIATLPLDAGAIREIECIEPDMLRVTTGDGRLWQVSVQTGVATEVRTAE